MMRLLLTSGRGPAECRMALARALETLTRGAEMLGLEVDCVAGPDVDGHGPASAIVVLHGAGAETFAAPWLGSIQWIAQSPLRPHHKRKNWFIGISVLPPEPVAAKPLALADVRFEAFRAGGPGGQHQNKTEIAVRAVHIASGLAVVAREERSQHRNRALALERLAALLCLQGQFAAIVDRQAAHAAHDQLERGRPAKRFNGAGCKEV
jgi:peptide chain release factor